MLLVLNSEVRGNPGPAPYNALMCFSDFSDAPFSMQRRIAVNQPGQPARPADCAAFHRIARRPHGRATHATQFFTSGAFPCPNALPRPIWSYRLKI